MVSHLATPMALVGPWPAARPAPRRGLELGPRDDPVDQAEALGLGGRDVVTEEEQLLGLLDPDQAGQDLGAAGVGGDPPPDEDLDELRLLGRHHQVAGERQVHAAAGRGAVDGGDDRLLAVEDGGDEALPAVADDPRRLADDVLGRALGLGPCGAAGRPQVGAGAEALLPGRR